MTAQVPQSGSQSRSSAGSIAPKGDLAPLPLERLLNMREQLGKLGLRVCFYSCTAGDPQAVREVPDGEGEPAPAAPEFCRRVCHVGRYCQDARRRLAQDVCASQADAGAQSPCGCWMLGVPIHRRRRPKNANEQRSRSGSPIGAAVACFPTRQTAGSEELARACSRLCLDGQYMAEACRKVQCHDIGQTQYLRQVLEWLLEHEQALQASNQELATLSTNLANTYEELSLLYRISSSMKVNESATQFFENLCRELLEVIGLEGVAVVLLGRQSADAPASPALVKGDARRPDSASPARQEQGSNAQVVQAGKLGLDARQIVELAKTCLLPDLHGSGDVIIDNQFNESHPSELAKPIHALIAVALAGSEGVMGLVMGINKLTADNASLRRGGEDLEFDSVDLKLVTSITSQAAVFLENNQLYEQLQDLLMGLLHALTASIDAKDPYTCGHSRRVATVSRRLAELSGVEAQRVERVYLAGLLHDIGKIGMPETVLCKPGRLTEEEFSAVKKHPQIGANILGGIRQLRDIIPAVLGHHERPDGRGYPHGLKGDEIPLEAMIVGLADSFDAMTSNRTYRPAMALEVVASEIRRCGGVQFKPALVDLLLGLDLQELLKDLWEELPKDDGQLSIELRCGQ